MKRRAVVRASDSSKVVQRNDTNLTRAKNDFVNPDVPETAARKTVEREEHIPSHPSSKQRYSESSLGWIDEWQYRIFKVIVFVIFVVYAVQFLDNHIHLTHMLIAFYGYMKSLLL